MSTDGPTIYLEVDGKPVPAGACSWLLVSPCGCVPGIMLAEFGCGTILTPEGALAEFRPNKEQRRRDARDGWTARLVSGRGVAVKHLTEECEHIPAWGRQPRPEMPGFQWAIASTRRSQQRIHLVPVDLSACGPHPDAQCGYADWRWSPDHWRVAETPTCLACERAARTGSVSSVV